MKVEIRRLEDLDCVDQIVGLPVGPHVGRSKEKKDWYVLRGFLKATIPCGLIELPLLISSGSPPHEPDFIMARGGSPVGLCEVTEATVPADQRAMALRENSKKKMSFVGEFRGRFDGGAGNPSVTWVSDILDAIRRKSKKTIFRASSAARHLLIYPNSNASLLMFDEDDEKEALHKLNAEISNDIEMLSNIVNGCRVHILCKYFLFFDALGDAKFLKLLLD